jgi:hypothetical protein
MKERMTTITRLVLALAMALAMSGCGDSRLDTTDAGAFIKSVQKMYNSVDGKEREDFAKFFFIAMNGRSDLITLSRLTSEEIPRLESFFNVLVSRKGPEEIQRLHGMSPEEIVELGRTLKITYLDGRMQELRRELEGFREASGHFAAYRSDASKIQLRVPDEVEKVVADKGVISEVHMTIKIQNRSSRRLVALSREDFYVRLNHGGREHQVEFKELIVTDKDGAPVFENGGVPASTDRELKVVGKLAHLSWAHAPKEPVAVKCPEDFAPGLEGWEEVFQKEDSLKRVFELERTLARLSRQMHETKA